MLDLLTLDDRNVYLGNGDNWLNVTVQDQKSAFEIQKLQIQLSHKDEIIDFQKREIARLEEMIALMKKAEDFICSN
jgi:hypothetical protein